MADLPVLRILVITEDSGDQGLPTVQTIARKALKIVDEKIDLGPKRVAIDSLAKDSEAWRAARANLWKARMPPPGFSKLLGAIATRLKEDGGFVLFHFDSDTTWTGREGSDNRQKFIAKIRNGVETILSGGARRPFDRRPFRTPDTPEIDTWLGRLLVFSPCYSIESWLYQNTVEVEARCGAAHAGSPENARAHAMMIRQWAADRTLLDELVRPKDDVLPCVADRWNADLAKGFPAKDVHKADRSFTEAVKAMSSCDALKDCVRRTYS